MTEDSRPFAETAAGGYSSTDGTVEFYARIRSLLGPQKTVLDFGAGRGGWFEDDKDEHRRSLRTLKGLAREVVACDVDEAVLENRSVDRAFICSPGSELSLPDESIDIVVCDYVFEHVTERNWLAGELNRVLKPGGWVCARTPGKYNYVAIFARLIPNRLHSRVLSGAQPGRKSRDVFPTRYRLNTRKDIQRAFSEQNFQDFTYYFAGEPAYYFGNRVVFRLLQLVARISPRWFYCNLFVFLRKNS